jgi:hypothetical protein
MQERPESPAVGDHRGDSARGGPALLDLTQLRPASASRRGLAECADHLSRLAKTCDQRLDLTVPIVPRTILGCAGPAARSRPAAAPCSRRSWSESIDPPPLAPPRLSPSASCRPRGTSFEPGTPREGDESARRPAPPTRRGECCR